MDISSMKKVILFILVPSLTGMVGLLIGYYAGISSPDNDVIKTIAPLEPYTIDLPVSDEDLKPVWSKALAEKVKGEAEFPLQDNSTVDVQTDDYAIQVVWLETWHQGIGKALHYAELSNRKPVVAIGVKRDEGNGKKLGTILMIAQKNGISVWILKAESQT